MKQLNEPYCIGFDFFRYIKPTLLSLYFPAGDVPFAPLLLLDEECSSPHQAETAGMGYQSALAGYYDLGYRLHKQVPLPRRTKYQLLQLLKKHPAPTLHDNYLFVRRHFPKHWLLYILLRRLLELKNPLKELAAFRNSAISGKVRSEPLTGPAPGKISASHSVTGSVSLIIATLNRYEPLKKLISQLEYQTIKPEELIIIDQSEQQSEEFSSTHIKIVHVHQPRKGQASARNLGISKASGEYLLFTDDDCELPPDWIEKHLDTFKYFPADASTGPFFENLDEKPVPQLPFFSHALQLPAGNFMAKKSFFEQLGTFDESLDGSPLEDTELYARAYHRGMLMICHDAAAVKHLKHARGGMREWGSNPPALSETFLQLMQKYYPPEAWKNILQAEQVKELLPFNQADKGLLQKLNMLWQLPFILYLSGRMMSRLKKRPS